MPLGVVGGLPPESASPAQARGSTIDERPLRDVDDDDDGDDDDEAIELPTLIEPKAQRSPWAWAAPPEWNREEDDDESSSRGA